MPRVCRAARYFGQHHAVAARFSIADLAWRRDMDVLRRARCAEGNALSHLGSSGMALVGRLGVSHPTEMQRASCDCHGVCPHREGERLVAGLVYSSLRRRIIAVHALAIGAEILLGQFTAQVLFDASSDVIRSEAAAK